jgi:hypothetical protein
MSLNILNLDSLVQKKSNVKEVKLMTNLKKFFDDQAAKIGEGVKVVGIMSKKAHIKHGAGKELSDILGWDSVIQTDERICYQFYAAQPPLIGMTQPQPIHCPLGIQVFDSFEVDIKKAIEILHTMNCGDTFIAIALSMPLVPDCKEPYWYIKLLHGNEVIIGANSGKANCYNHLEASKKKK